MRFEETEIASSVILGRANSSLVFLGVARESTVHGIVGHQSFTRAVYQVLDDIQLLFRVVGHQVAKLPQIAIPREKHGMRKGTKLSVQHIHPVRLHGVQIHRLGIRILRSPPGRTGKQLKLPGQRPQPQIVLAVAVAVAVAAARPRRNPGLGRQGPGVAAPQPQQQVGAERPRGELEPAHKVEAVGVDPGDVLGDAVDARVVLGAGERRGVALDADDVGPKAVVVVVGLFLLCEGDGVAAGAGEHVDYDAGLVVVVLVCEGGRRFAGEIGCYLSEGGEKKKKAG